MAISKRTAKAIQDGVFVCAWVLMVILAGLAMGFSAFNLVLAYDRVQTTHRLAQATHTGC